MPAELPLADLQAAAEGGSAEAQVALAERLSFPADGQPADDAAAAAWLRRAADQGHAEARYRLGLTHYAGRGVPRDHAAAAGWWRLAAEQGHAGAQFWIGWLTEWGFGVEADPVAAVAWYRKAAEQGYAEAQSSLGGAYAAGKGVAQDVAEAVRWLRLAAAQHEPSGEYQLGQMYTYGAGVERDDAEAARWYGRAAEQGFTAAQTTLAASYLSGTGVPKSEICAYLWAGLAAEGGYEAGAELRDVLAEQLPAADLAYAQRLLERSTRGAGLIQRPLCPGETLSISVQAMSWDELASSFGLVTALDVVVPPRAAGSLAIEAADVPWETVLGQLLAGTGYGWRRDGVRLVIEPLPPPPDRP